MRIGASGKTALGPEFRSRPSAVKQPEDDAPVQTGTNLVMTETPAALTQDQRPLNRPLATFLTQLIAKSQNMPSTRVKCRIDPAEGTKVYRGVSKLSVAPKHG
jgi:hypothetical protein